mmetsp:Transcript_88559/g.258864  ORF Transcript_88559/g.258864 Transcript_88559/m.258864 type:complete len:294 (+) Transcript_88559:600-1481(+)
MEVPVDGSRHPGYADAQENVHGVAARDIHDGSISPLILLRGSPRREEVRHGRPQRHEGDGRDLVVDAGGAAEELREVADDDGDPADVEQGAPEADPAPNEGGRGREDSEHDLPREPDRVNDPVAASGRLLVGSTALDIDRLLDLFFPHFRAQAHLLEVDHAVEPSPGPGAPGVRPRVLVDDVHRQEAPFIPAVTVGIEFQTSIGVLQNQLEGVILVPDSLWQNGHSDLCRGRAVSKLELSREFFVIVSRRGSHHLGSVAAGDTATGAVLAKHWDSELPGVQPARHGHGLSLEG